MDHSQQERCDWRRQRRSPGRNAAPTQQQQQQQQPLLRPRLPVQNARPTSYMSSVPPPQWQDIPLPYRPRDYEQYRHSTVPESLYNWHLLPPQERRTNRSAQRRPGALESVPGREQFEAAAAGMDPTLFYPQISPNFSTHSAPDDLEGLSRVMTQASTPSPRYSSAQQQELEPPSVPVVPRSPTYPPATGRRRIRSGNTMPESTFTGVEDFHLFVQATAGLGPDQAFRLSNSPSSGSSENGDTSTDPRRAPNPEQHVSPLQDTPTTVYALQQLAQMPQGSAALQQHPMSSILHQHSSTHRPSAAATRADSWLHPPDDPYEDDEDDLRDEELPDYAMSQAQAQAAQRIEAARRAQELQRRWQQSR